VRLNREDAACRVQQTVQPVDKKGRCYSDNVPTSDIRCASTGEMRPAGVQQGQCSQWIRRKRHFDYHVPATADTTVLAAKQQRPLSRCIASGGCCCNSAWHVATA
jgi:hypothetical protein